MHIEVRTTTYWTKNCRKSIALEAGHASAIKLKNAKPAPHSVVASAREYEDDDDDDADWDDADGSGANWRAPTKVDKQVATMTPWVNSSAFKSILLELITRGLHEREIIFKTNPIFCRLSPFSRTNRELRFSSSPAEAQRVSEDVLTAMICTGKKN